MADKEIKVAYKVTSAEFNSGIKDINSSLTTLNKEFRLQKEEMRLTASETEKLEANLSKLSQEYTLAQQKTELTAQAFEKAKQLMGENSKEAQSWGNKLLDAQRNEEYLKNAITETNTALDQAKSAMSESAQESERNKQAIAELEAEQQQLAAESKLLNSELKLQQSAMSETATDAERLENAQQGLSQQSELVARQIQNLEQQLSLAKQEYGENSREVLELETALNESKTAFNQLENEMRNVGDASGEASNGMEQVTAVMKADLLMQFGEQLQNISEKLIELGQSALEAFQEVDEGMDIIVTKTGASGKPLEDMQTQAKEIAKTLPTDFATVGNAVGEVNTQFGLTGDALRLASEDMIKFSEINGADVTDSTIGAKQALEAYGMSVDWLSDVLDTTTSVAQSTGVSVDDLMTKAIEGAPQIKALGLSFGEGVALMGQFEQAGVDSGAALSSLSKASVAYAKDGLTLQEGLQGTIDAILNAKDETEALSIAQEVFGQRGALKMVDAIKRGTFSMDELSKVAEESSGKVSKTFKEIQDPIDGFVTASNISNTALAEIGDVIATVLAPIMEMLAEMLQKIVHMFMKLPEPVQQFIVLIGLVTTAIGVLAPIFFVLQAAAVAAEMSILGFIKATLVAIAPIALIIAAIVAFGVAIKYLWDTNEQFREAILNIWNSILAFIQPIISSIVAFITTIWGSLVTWWNENNALIMQTAQSVWGWIQGIITAFMTYIVPFLQTGWQYILNNIQIIWNLIQGVVMTALGIVQGIITAVMQAINGDWSGAWETIKRTVTTAWENIKSIVTQYVNGVKQNIVNTFNEAKGKVESIFGGILNAIKEKMEGAKNAVRDAVNKLLSIMDFKWSLPHLSLPTITINGGFSLNPPRVPTFGIRWNAEGGIMMQPTIFGRNGKNFLGGGEAGPEAILPLTDKVLGTIGDQIYRNMSGQVINQGGNTNHFTINAEIASDYDVDRMIDLIDEKLGQKETIIARGRGIA